MNREIKFRGKRLDNGEWVCGSLVIDDYGNCQIIEFADHHEQWHDVDPATVGQYTKLKDENGKEIYDGDILLSYGVKYKVVYTCAAMGIPINNLGRTEFLWSLVTGYEPCEIIGNIHDNPELLKTE